MKFLFFILSILILSHVNAKDNTRIGLTVRNTSNESELYFSCKNKACSKYNVVLRKPGKNSVVVGIDSEELASVSEMFNIYIKNRVENFNSASGLMNSNENESKNALNTLLENVGLKAYPFQTNEGKVQVLKQVFEKESYSIVEKMVNPEFRNREKFLDPIIYDELVKVIFEE